MLKNLKSKTARVAAGVTGVLLAPAVFAQAVPPDFSTLTAGIDFSTVTTAIMAVALTLIGVYVAIKGAKIVMQMIRGG